MKKLHHLLVCAPALIAGSLFLTGCQDKNKNGVPESPATAPQIERSLENAGKTVEEGVQKAVPAIEKTVSKGADMAGDAVITGKVKAALIENKTISASEIDVTTKNKIVYLNGHVASNAQRALASQIARKAAGAGYPIKNGLKVAAKAPVKSH